MNESDHELAALHPAQRTSARARPLPRRTLDARTSLLLLAMRIYVTVAVPLVIFAFFRALGS
ncbi:MAG: hypothetical protein NVS2B3_00460 [Vulcanimicrobiaceae bacterium]